MTTTQVEELRSGQRIRWAGVTAETPPKEGRIIGFCEDYAIIEWDSGGHGRAPVDKASFWEKVEVIGGAP